MSQSVTSWADICRQACGEQLIQAYGQTMTQARKAFLDQNLHLLVSLDGEVITREAAAAKKPTLRIMSLPFAVREQILQHLQEVKTVRVFLLGLYGVRPTPIQLPITARAGDRTLRLETIRTTLLNSEIEIHSGPANHQLQQWLASLDFSCIPPNLRDGFDVVRKLSFPYFSRFPHYLPHITLNQDVNLMRKCQNLKRVSLHFVATTVFRNDGSGMQKMADQLVPEYHLNEMLELDELEVLHFSGFCSDESDVGVRGLARWFKEQYDNRKDRGLRKKEVKVVLSCGEVVQLGLNVSLGEVEWYGGSRTDLRGSSTKTKRPM
ncbi:unnamed protein product [Cercospora beticola]|nr:unnamed protein product [Cercospora beticola]